MRTTPVLLIAYNRVDNAQRLLSCLREHRTENLIFAVDGPKPNNAEDIRKVQQVRDLANTIDWTDKFETRFRPSNMGLRASVTEAVSYAVSQHGQVIVLEDDTAPGPLWVPYANKMLDSFRSENKVEHISGYNLVPDKHLASPERGSRLSRYPESFAWATWDRAWDQFDGTLDWALNASVADIKKIVGSSSGALRWKQNFLDAEAGRINSWAYRWISSMWSRDSFVMSPNANLITYTGFEEGTHTLMKAPWSELPQYQGSLESLIPQEIPVLDQQADEWVAKQVFAETPFGVARGVAITTALEARRRYRLLK
jgi:glycosyltransferase involved in cell wall biosynthesis